MSIDKNKIYKLLIYVNGFSFDICCTKKCTHYYWIYKLS